MFPSSRAGGPTGNRLRHIVACDIRPHVVKSVAPKIIAGHAWDNVGYSSHDKDTKNNCSCEPTHDQAQPETRYGVSGSHSEAQRQNLLRSPGHFSQFFRNHLQTGEATELWGCMLVRNRRGRNALRLDREPRRNPSGHQCRAQAHAPARVFILDQLGHIGAGQGLRPAVRYRTLHSYSTRTSCPIGQLKFLNSTGDKQPVSVPSYKLQATGYKCPPRVGKNFLS